MKQNLFLFLCLTGFVPVVLQIISRNYYLITTQMTWSNAQSYCRMMYTDLAIVKNHVDYSQLMKEGARKALTLPAWVGLYNNVTSWRWSLNEIFLVNANFENWYPGQPDNANAKESCAAVIMSGYWADVPCTDLKPFICYNANFTGSERFVGVASPLLNWFGAQAYCRTHHTDLASSLNSLDNNYIMQLSNIQGDSWFGLYRDTWTWIDGTNATDLKWYSGQPNNNWGTENCSPIFKGLYIDEVCSNLRPFFCYTNSPVKKQIMRLQVKSDASVSLPAIQLFILQQIKQKLEENAMLKNITVFWRIQPDQNIFYKKNIKTINV